MVAAFTLGYSYTVAFGHIFLTTWGTAGNLIWNPYHSLNLGMELLYAWRVNKDGASGNAPRIMFSAKYNFIRAQSTE
jgi:hypothetical protein